MMTHDGGMYEERPTCREPEARQVEESLRFTRFLFDHSADAVFWIDSDARFVDVNRAACTSLGYSREELLAMTVHDIDLEFPRATWREHWKTTRELGSRVVESRHQARDGRVFPVEITVSCLEYEGKCYHCAVARDVTERKEMENALRKHQEDLESLIEARTLELVTSEARYRCLVERSPAAIHVYSTRRGGIYYSPRVESLLGYSVDHLLENPFLWNVSIHPDDRPKVKDAIKKAKRLGTFDVEYRVKHARGKWIWLHDCSVAVRCDRDEVVIEGLAQDITPRKRAEEALRESEIRYRTVANFTHDWEYWIGPDKALRYMSDSCERITGYTPEEFLGDASLLHRLVVAEDRGVWYEHDLWTERSRDPREVQFRIRRRDGKIRWIEQACQAVEDDQGEFLGYRASNRDVTDRKDVERALRTSEARFRGFAERSFDVIFMTDLEGVITYLSPAAETVFLYRPEEMTGRHFSDFLPQREIPRAARAFADAVQREVFARIAFDALKKDGTCVSVELSASPIVSDGRLSGTQGVIRDVSDRKQHEAALREAHQRLQETLDELRATQEQVIQQERLRALGEMASGVGHDLNNSLSPVMGYSEMLLQDARLPGDAREFVRWIRKGARDAAAVVARLREFYRPSDPGEARRPVELVELIDEVVQLTRPKWRDKAQREGKRVELDVQAGDATWALGNAAEIREVLTNLVFNAVDAVPSGGCVTLRLRGESGNAVVEVSDTGLGMSDDVRARCIEPFFTTKGNAGTGLGLSVCHGIVQRHGGRIEIDSAPGRGTTVRVFLPATEEGPLAENSVADVPLPASRVLYIDDDPQIRAVVGDMLRTLGQEVDLAEGGARGLELLEANQYDLVITDRGMPEMDGHVVTGRIKALWSELPVAMLTGWGSSGANEPEESGCAPDYILSKPPRLDEMRQLLIKLTPEWGATEIGRAGEMGPVRRAADTSAREA